MPFRAQPTPRLGGNPIQSDRHSPHYCCCPPFPLSPKDFLYLTDRPPDIVRFVFPPLVDLSLVLSGSLSSILCWFRLSMRRRSSFVPERLISLCDD